MSGWTLRFMVEETYVRRAHPGIWRRVRGYLRSGNWEEFVRPTRRGTHRVPVGPHIDIPDPTFTAGRMSFDTSAISINSPAYWSHSLVGTTIYCDGRVFLEGSLSRPIHVCPSDTVGLAELAVTMVHC